MVVLGHQLRPNVFTAECFCTKHFYSGMFFDQMFLRRNVFLPNVFAAECFSTKCFYGGMFFDQTQWSRLPSFWLVWNHPYSNVHFKSPVNRKLQAFLESFCLSLSHSLPYSLAHILTFSRSETLSAMSFRGGEHIFLLLSSNLAS